MSIISKRYAKALLSRAKEEKAERSLYLDIKYLNILYLNNFQLYTIFNNYQISPEKKKQILLSITNNKISNLTLKNVAICPAAFNIVEAMKDRIK